MKKYYTRRNDENENKDLTVLNGKEKEIEMMKKRVLDCEYFCSYADDYEGCPDKAEPYCDHCPYKEWKGGLDAIEKRIAETVNSPDVVAPRKLHEAARIMRLLKAISGQMSKAHIHANDRHLFRIWIEELSIRARWSFEVGDGYKSMLIPKQKGRARELGGSKEDNRDIHF
jgi:hypothetical protein